MKDKKNIDRLFQENFKDFEETPSPKVWKNIERELKGRKKRRVIPLWYKIGGVAAVLALLFFVGNAVFSDQLTTPVANGDQQRSMPEQTIKPETNDILTSPENSVTSNKTDSSGSIVADEQSVKQSVKQSVVSAETEGGSNQNTSEKETNSVLNASTSERSNLNKAESERSVASNSGKSRQENAGQITSETNKAQKETRQNITVSETTKRESQLASAERESKVNQQNESAINKERLSKKNTGNHQQSERLANQNNGKLSETQEETYSEKESNSTPTSLENRLAENESDIKSADESAIDTMQLANVAQNDSVDKKSLIATAEALQQQKDTEEKDKEEKDEKEKTNPSKWLVSPSVSPIYYSSLNGGNTVDPKFSDSQGKGEVTMAYGINFAYQLSERFKIRSGISKVNMGYKTNDIAFTSSVNAMALKGVRNSANAGSIEVLSENEATTNNVTYARGEVAGSEVNSFSTGSINQQFGFLEVPVEVEYALLDKRFGINLIGGASTLFLNNNDVTINSQQGTTDLGEASNINKVSFTTNIGVGFGYEITKKFGVKLEPTFKYQINTFGGNTNGFQPYYFGVYTGFSFKF